MPRIKTAEGVRFAGRQTIVGADGVVTALEQTYFTRFGPSEDTIVRDLWPLLSTTEKSAVQRLETRLRALITAEELS